MMARPTDTVGDDFDDGKPGALRHLPWIIAALLAFAAAYGLWVLSNQTVGKPKPAPPSTTALLLPPPPPPPPPPEQEKPPEPTETKPVPTEVPTPSPAKADAPAPVTMNAEAQAGADGGLASGSGGGMGGSGATGTGTGAAGGVSDNFYAANLRDALQARIQADDRVNRQLFSADFAVWVDGRGKITRADLKRSSGDSKRDALLGAVLLATDGLDPPPASIRFPARITVRGRKSF
ncbi:MAG: TonB-dependent receptor [Polymorphobacter sp.]